MSRPVIAVPSTFCVASVTMSRDVAATSTKSPYSMAEQTFLWPGEQWRADISLANITNKLVANQWKSFGTALKGVYGMFLLGDPSARIPAGVANGSPLVDGGGQAGNLLNIKNAVASVTNWLRDGDMVQVGTGVDSRLHMNIGNVNTNGAGKATLTLQPALRYPPADNVAITLVDAKGMFNMVGNTWSWSVKPGPVWNISFQAEEVIGA